ncbi:MAG TPA: hypothetical protein VN872_05645 [Candidatus Acidoferrum sp.]|nr:hypothetical protein [Candidatus Acidoferrum sp.]
MNRALIVTFYLLGVLAPAQTATPNNPKHQFVEVKLKDKELLKMATGKEMSLPQLRVYDKQGQLVGDFNDGFDDATFKDDFDKLLQSAKPITGKAGLTSELDIIVNLKNKALKNLPPADFTIVEYWADWCKPCHQQLELLHQALKAHETVAINILHVQADPTKLPGMKVVHQK